MSLSENVTMPQVHLPKDPPINPEEYLKHAPKNIEVKRCSLDPGVAGMLKNTGDGWVIYVNSDEPETRQRFTIAHEIGHLHLHSDVIGDHTDFYRKSELKDYTEDQLEMERQANKFAAALLMPQGRVFQEWLAQLKRSDGLFGGGRVKRMSEIFGVSEEAMTYRLKNLGLISRRC